MLRLMHISDLHFGPPFVARVGEAVLELAPKLRPSAVIASGDFTQRGTESQFMDARAFLDRLPQVPMVPTPGNHDIPLFRFWERLVNPHGLYRKYICDELDRVWKLPGATVVSLDSTSPRRAISNGRISSRQLDFCEQAFSVADPQDAKVVVAHHHFAPAHDRWHDWAMPKAGRAMQRFCQLGVDLILGGHLHRSFIGDSLDFYPHLETGHQGVIIVQCGTSTSRRGRGRERERNTLNVIDISERMIVVEHRMYFDDSNEFEPISCHHFPRRGRRWEED